MDILSFLKLVHVVAAVAWVGGGLAFIVLGNLLMARGDRAAALSVVSLTAPLGNLWFLPSALITLTSGLTLFWLGGWSIDGWSALALVLVAVVFGIGVAVAKPAGERVAALMAGGETGAAMAEATSLMHLSRFDGTCMIAIVALMVLKPSWDDVAVLAGIAGVVAAVGLLNFATRQPEAA